MPTKKPAPTTPATPSKPNPKMAAASHLAIALEPAVAAPAPTGGKMGLLVELMQRPQGATIADMMAATDWQQHSIRGALAGALKKKGYDIVSAKPDDIRIYKIAPPAPATPPTRKRTTAKAG